MVKIDKLQKAKLKKVAREIIAELKKGKIITQNKFNRLKLKVIKKHSYPMIPTNVNIAHFATNAERSKLKGILSMKPVRELSGVNVIAVMSKPHKCPHGKCIYCPGGLDSYYGDVPQSYTGKEPATRRAIRNDYDPYLQVMNRLEQYVAMNKIPDKAELIVMGGTFPSLPKIYQREFIMCLFKALNDFSKLFFDKRGRLMLKKFQKFFELPGDLDDEERQARIKARLRIEKQKNKRGLEYEHKRNDKSKLKCVGLTLETRPDYGLLKQGNFMLELGCTKVELGVQTTRPDILKKIQRGHDMKTTIRSIRELKDLGFKLNFHFMPGLPGMTKKEMIDDFKTLFDDEDFQPDMLKIYPCMVMRGTKLYMLWKGKKYKPLTTSKAKDLIIEFKKYVRNYCRIMRVQRDIPTFVTEAGVGMTNLRQEISKELKKNKIECDCIRCNEIGRSFLRREPDINVITYHSSKGVEFFIYYGDDRTIVGFCRLRFPSQLLRKEVVDDSAFIRELHVYGESVEIGTKGKKKISQHRGIGKKMMKTAEEICSTYYKRKLLVIAAVGTRSYYRKLGYKANGPYMSKMIE